MSEFNPDETKAENITEIQKWMKKNVYVREDILAQAIHIFKQNNVEVYGAPYEADFQLVHWEKIGFTDGSITVDSDLFAMGSQFLVDELNVHSKDACCMIIEYRVVMESNAFTAESSSWTSDNLLVYSALCGCDFLPRLSGLKEKRH